MLPDEGPSSYELAPTSEEPRMPWEETDRGLAWRLWATLGSTFHPVRDVARVCHGQVVSAGRFAVLTAVPAAFASGIIPLTQRMMFDSGGAVTFEPGSSGAALTLDVLRAGGLGIAQMVFAWLLMAWNFAALARFVADPNLAPVHPLQAAWRVCLYRAWLMPAAMVMFFVTLWLGPEPNDARARMLNYAFQVLPSVIQMLHFSAVARYLGASTLAAIPTSLVPVVVFWAALWAGNATLLQLDLVPMPEPPTS